MPVVYKGPLKRRPASLLQRARLGEKTETFDNDETSHSHRLNRHFTEDELQFSRVVENLDSFRIYWDDHTFQFDRCPFLLERISLAPLQTFSRL